MRRCVAILAICGQVRGQAKRSRLDGRRSRQRSAARASRVDWCSSNGRRDVLSGVVNHCKLRLRDRIIRSAVIKIDTAWNKLATVSQLIRVIEDLGFEVALVKMNISS